MEKKGISRRRFGQTALAAAAVSAVGSSKSEASCTTPTANDTVDDPAFPAILCVLRNCKNALRVIGDRTIGDLFSNTLTAEIFWLLGNRTISVDLRNRLSKLRGMLGPNTTLMDLYTTPTTYWDRDLGLTGLLNAVRELDLVFTCPWTKVGGKGQQSATSFLTKVLFDI